jgi:hypothetical protein
VGMMIHRRKRVDDCEDWSDDSNALLHSIFPSCYTTPVGHTKFRPSQLFPPNVLVNTPRRHVLTQHTVFAQPEIRLYHFSGHADINRGQPAPDSSIWLTSCIIIGRSRYLIAVLFVERNQSIFIGVLHICAAVGDYSSHWSSTYIACLHPVSRSFLCSPVR